MIQVAKIVIIASLPKPRFFHSTSIYLELDSENGLELDSTQEIADKYHGDKEGINSYFSEKEKAIINSYRVDSNSAAASGVSVEELNQWLEDKNDLLEQLAIQKVDAMDLASIPSTPQDSSDVVQTDFTSSEPFDE